MKNFLASGPLMDLEPAPAGGGAPPFDMNAFMARIEQTVNKVVDAKLKAAAPPEPPAPEPEPEPAPAPTPAPAPAAPPAPTPAPAAPPADNDLLRAMQKELKSVKEKQATKDRESAEQERRLEEKDRMTSIKSHLATVPYASDRARAIALENYKNQVKRGSDGETLTGPDGITSFTEWLDAQIQLDDYLLAPVDKNGAGSMNTGRNKQPALDLSQLKPGMPQEELKRFRAEIARVAQQTMLGQ